MYAELKGVNPVFTAKEADKRSGYKSFEYYKELFKKAKKCQLKQDRKRILGQKDEENKACL